MFSTLSFKFCNGVYKRGQKYNITNFFITVFFKCQKKSTLFYFTFISKIFLKVGKSIGMFESNFIYCNYFTNLTSVNIM